jgi:hypothetical protein
MTAFLPRYSAGRLIRDSCVCSWQGCSWPSIPLVVTCCLFPHRLHAGHGKLVEAGLPDQLLDKIQLHENLRSVKPRSSWPAPT